VELAARDEAHGRNLVNAAAPTWQDALARRIAAFDHAALRSRFLADNEFIHVPDFLGPETLATLLAQLPALQESVNRNYLPGHKQGGSVSRHVLAGRAVPFRELYQSAPMLDFVRRVGCDQLDFCPPEDPHAYALYYYTRAGDHIGWHYDTSYYRGARYTVLIGLVDRSACRLEYRVRAGAPVESIALAPGALVLFNGDKLHHRITPARDGDERVALTLEYLTDARMHPWWRLISNWKDAVAYFGVGQVFGRRGGTR
jgi:alkylated DNA repair dioxygenase AlkB